MRLLWICECKVLLLLHLRECKVSSLMMTNILGRLRFSTEILSYNKTYLLSNWNSQNFKPPTDINSNVIHRSTFETLAIRNVQYSSPKVNGSTLARKKSTRKCSWSLQKLFNVRMQKDQTTPWVHKSFTSIKRFAEVEICQQGERKS